MDKKDIFYLFLTLLGMVFLGLGLWFILPVIVPLSLLFIFNHPYMGWIVGAVDILFITLWLLGQIFHHRRI